MAKFVYRFESVQRVKKVVEKKAQKELAQIENTITDVKIKLRDLLTEKKVHKTKMLKKKNLKASELQFFSNYDKCMSNKIVKTKNELRLLEAKKGEKLRELSEKSKERKIFEKLEEKHLEDFNIEQNKADLIAIDDIATKKFVREKNR